MAGDGQLRDDSQCSQELREYVRQISTTKIANYIEQCLSSSFGKGGIVLQDLVNELGRRLDYNVVDGRYQGVVGGIGFDGLWSSPEGHSLVAEVKTTDAYRLSLDTLANYRAKLAAAGKLTANSSILIIVGRQDTGELEAQIRGSRHAWDVRVISAEALIKLVQLKENSEATETGLKIRSLLIPVEYGTGIPAAVLILRKNKADRDVLFIDASGDFKPGKNQNQLTRDHLDKILETYQARQSTPRYAHLATPEEIAENDWNLNIPRYVDTFEEEEEIDLVAVRAERLKLKEELAALDAQMDRYLSELGF